MTCTTLNARAFRWRLVAWAVLVLAVTCVGLGSLAFVDPDEAFYPAAAAESLDAGRPLDLTLNGEPRWNKPPLQYALIQASFTVLGRTEFAARLVPAVEGALLVLLLGWLAVPLAGRRGALLASIVLGSTLGHAFYSRAAHPEMAQTLFSAVAQLLWMRWLLLPDETRRWRLPLIAGACMGLGLLGKSPVAFLLPSFVVVAGLPLLARDARPSWGRALGALGTAWLVGLAVAAPWFLWMGARHGDAFWNTVFAQLGHWSSEDFRHDADHPLYFVPVLIAGGLPWIVLLPRALRGLRTGPSMPADGLRRLAAVALGTAFLFFSLSSSKLPNYGLAFFPSLALLVGPMLATDFERGAPRDRWLTFGVALLPWAALAAYPWFADTIAAAAHDPRLADPTVSRAIRRAAGLGFLAALFLRPVRASTAYPTWMRVPAMLCLLLVPALLGVAGRLDQRRFDAFAETIRWDRHGEPQPVAVYRKRLPSLSFYLRDTVAWPHSPEELAAFLEQDGVVWLVIHERHLDLVDQDAVLRDHSLTVEERLERAFADGFPAFTALDDGAGYVLLRRWPGRTGGLRDLPDEGR